MREVVIIGGGLAGSAVATALAQIGKDVLLLEKEPKAHDKVCGEFVSVEAQHYFSQLGMDLTKLGAARITNVRLARDQISVSAKLPFEALSLSRRILDDTVLSHAQNIGAEIRRGHTVTALEEEHGYWRLKISGAEDIFTETVFLATGKHDLRNWRRVSPVQKDFIGFKMHFRLMAAQSAALAGHVEMSLFDGGYAGLEQIEDGKANLCLVILKQKFNEYGKSWDGVINKILEASPSLSERLTDAEQYWPRPLSIFGIPYGFVYRPMSNSPTNLYRLGDQMAVIPSFSGDGMSIALHTAALASKYYLNGGASSYHKHAFDDLALLVRRASFISGLAGVPIIQTGFMLACGLYPNLLASIAAHTRIKNIL